MSAEHHHESSAEHAVEKATELQEAAGEQLEKLRADKSETGEHAEARAEKAREVIKEQAAEVEPEPVPAAETQATPSRPAAFLDHRLNYTQTMASIQRKLTPASRNFSKVIHTPAVEKASEALEKTVARPSVMLGTTWTALIVGAMFYVTARNYGYALSGSELLFSFIVGALLGLVGEGVWRALRRR